MEPASAGADARYLPAGVQLDIRQKMWTPSLKRPPSQMQVRWHFAIDHSQLSFRRARHRLFASAQVFTVGHRDCASTGAASAATTSVGGVGGAPVAPRLASLSRRSAAPSSHDNGSGRRPG